MGLRETLHDRHIYFDTNIFIYLFEGYDKHQDQLEVIKELLASGSIQVSSSQLTYTEMLPPLVKSADQDLIQQMMDFLGEEGIFSLHPVSQDVCIQAGVLRGQMGMKTPDAIHVATAIYQGCDVFLTNDKKIKAPKGMEIILLSYF